MKLKRNLSALLCCFFILGLAACSSKAASSPATAGELKPAGSSPFYTDPNSSAADWVEAHASDPRAALIRQKIANQPKGRWLGDWTPNVEQEASAYAKAAAAAGKTPIFVAYNIPGRDCGQYSSGARVARKRIKPGFAALSGASVSVRRW